MEQYHYLIIGGGLAADSAIRAIRARDTTARIGVISDDIYPCYDRTMLSKGLWRGTPITAIWLRTESEGVTFHLKRRAVAIDEKKHIVRDHAGGAYWYKKLLIATGGSPKKLTCKDEGVLYFRSLQDYHALRALYENGTHFCVIGGGFLAPELTTALVSNGKKVVHLLDTPALYYDKLPRGFSMYFNALFVEKGVDLRIATQPLNISKYGEQFAVETQEETLIVDGVIAAAGITPNLAMAEQLKQDDGLLVDRYLRTSDPDIYAAGDVANFFSPHLKRRVRVEHENCAVTMGAVAGANMAGDRQEYLHLPHFYSECFELAYEGIGIVDADLDLVEDWDILYRKGAIYYLDETELLGCMVFGMWDKMETVRALFSAQQDFQPEELIGKLND